MALILPRPIMAAITTAAYMITSGFRPIRLFGRNPLVITTAAYMITSGFRPNRRIGAGRWRYILRDSRYFWPMAAANSLLLHGDYLLISLTMPTDQLGVYYFAFNLSTQTVQLVSANLTSILLPTFAKLNREPERLHAAYLRVCRTVVSIGMIICLIQALLAEPLLHLLFGDKWNDSIPLVQILSVGMAFVLPSSATMSLMQSQGLYRRVMWWTIFVTISFLAFTATGVAFGTTYAVAVVVALFYVVFGPLGVAFAFQGPSRNASAAIRYTYLAPVLAGATAASAVLGCLQLLEGGNTTVNMLASLFAGLSIYFAIIFLFHRQHWTTTLKQYMPAAWHSR